ncbi:MAG: hypothetical protein R3C19_12355 [Planctomycetaceae bacterium]
MDGPVSESGNGTENITDLAIADEIIVYAAAAIDDAGSGQEVRWLECIRDRCMAGRSGRSWSGGALTATETDFGPGGAITFDTTGVTWNFDDAAPGGGESDFFSVAIHELAHLLGFGTSASFQI